MQGRVLIVAGSDSGGGAGIQADLKTVTALGGFGMTAITALTAQNTLGVFGVLPVEPDFVVQQMDVVLDDLGADAVKTGMLHSPEVIEAVSVALERRPGLPLVVDPVMVAQSGATLLQDAAVAALKQHLLPQATLLTPNLPEAEKLIGRSIDGAAGMEAAAQEILAMGPEAVLLKGGHLSGDWLIDVLVTAGGVERFEGPRIDTEQTHGTGCTLASAIATGLAQGLSLADAVRRARAYLQEALRTAPGLGRGQGPVNHGHTVGHFDG
ncbi:bifunctional hydroxymethylpyrimidine kinase/phosphomethylpyrimidine kinase [Aquibaculum arenosum]|uniref:hydroxymethylpyrimidine kinase n=1 Tax=Aquibaculum arenosum TaxID=3032591 RepID=A0ABT5YIT2_9PROT|nr:bifunctional hydroxymethylpyrimidine kinase/phosphomethylpyrimidine kinase [Fodinicurvata sp. CAU 1616]MDF2094728.1 bifunctional hydroxymethylpyrimidine kinase/phosphomethylpyrimidine kinase [Fodinicurvata sp. CAU 1616]